MNHFLACVLVAGLGALPTAWFASRVGKSEAQLFWLALGGHILASITLVWMTNFYYPGGDMNGYHHIGTLYADILYADFARYAPELLKFALQDPSPAIETFGHAGGSTGSMLAWSGFVMFFVGGESIYAGCMLVAVLAHVALAATYLAYRSHVPHALRIRVMSALVLLPSALFWCSGLVKEAFAILGLSAMFVGFERLLSRRRYFVSGLLLIALGATVTGTVKAYVIFAFVIAAAVWWYLESTRPKPGEAVVLPQLWVVALGAGLGFLALSGLGTIFPRFAVENLAGEAANLQYFSYREGEGSNYAFGDATELSLTGQLAFAPLGLLFSLFRPFPFEVRNMAMLMNTVETTFLTYLAFRSASRIGLRGFVRVVRRQPIVGFSVVFVLVVGVGVGLTSTNLGTLSRYRIPMMPFYAATLAWLSAAPARQRARKAVTPVAGRPHPARSP